MVLRFNKFYDIVYNFWLWKEAEIQFKHLYNLQFYTKDGKSYLLCA